MCPFCLATAAMIAGSIATTGGITAFVIKKTLSGKITNNHPTTSPTTEDHNG